MADDNKTLARQLQDIKDRQNKPLVKQLQDIKDERKS